MYSPVVHQEAVQEKGKLDLAKLDHFERLNGGLHKEMNHHP